VCTQESVTSQLEAEKAALLEAKRREQDEVQWLSYCAKANNRNADPYVQIGKALLLESYLGCLGGAAAGTHRNTTAARAGSGGEGGAAGASSSFRQLRSVGMLCGDVVRGGDVLWGRGRSVGTDVISGVISDAADAAGPRCGMRLGESGRQLRVTHQKAWACVGELARADRARIVRQHAQHALHAWGHTARQAARQKQTGAAGAPEDAACVGRTAGAEAQSQSVVAKKIMWGRLGSTRAAHLGAAGVGGVHHWWVHHLDLIVMMMTNAR
jgi:hypothetical protein